MTGGELLLAAGILTVAASLQAAVGFGANLIAAPLLVLLDPRLVPGPLIVMGLVLTTLMVLREKERADNRDIGLAISGRIPGNILGAIVLVAVPSDHLGLVFGALVLVAVVLSARGWHVRPTPRALVGAGAASGFMGTTVSIGGPPMALVYQDEPGPRLRGTLARILAIGAALSLLAVAVVGRFGWEEAAASLALLPGVIVGFLLGRPLARHLDRGHTRTAVLVVAAVSAVAVLVQALA